MSAEQIEVIVIGTEPPCPRCSLVSQYVRDIIKGTGDNISFVHVPFDSAQAQDFGRRFGKKVGTAKQVAEAAHVDMDWPAVYEIVERRKAIQGEACSPADLWSPELDSALEPCRRAADSVGYLMTPILIVSGDVKHHGSVPSFGDVLSWVLGPVSSSDSSFQSDAGARR
jgi:hypothetical protein